MLQYNFFENYFLYCYAMPHYDYRCRTCGKKFEYFQSITSDALTHCPESVCEQEIKGKGYVERTISKGAGLIFNGSGFYQTDYVKHGSSAENVTSGASSADKAASVTSVASETST